MEALTASLVLWAKTQALGWLARHWPKLVGAVVLAWGGVVFIGVTAVSLASTTGQGASAANACSALGYTVDEAAYEPPAIDQTPAIPSGGAVAGFGPTDSAKIRNAQAIIAAGTEAGVGRRGLTIAIATALQESGLENLDHGDRDSLGVFQQRPSQGWGTPQQVQDPRFAALAFFGGPTSPHFVAMSGRASPGGLLDVAGWAELPLTVAAQTVQRSAFPGAYAKHEARATVIVDALAGAAPTSVPPGVLGTSAEGQGADGEGVAWSAAYRANGVDIDAFCASTFELASGTGPGSVTPGSAIVPAGEWTAPLHARITSGFGDRYHPVFHEWRLHAGTDFHAPVGTAIAAPSVGIIRAVSWSSGGGLTVTIAHAAGVETQHLHLSEALVRPGEQVQGGQVIALSGASGVGTGPHYHFEVHVDGAAVDPVPFMSQRGVDLGAWP